MESPRARFKSREESPKDRPEPCPNLPQNPSEEQYEHEHQLYADMIASVLLCC